MPISLGWAAGDVSLAAYIQACLARREGESDNVSALGAVMAFLYSTYIVIYAILSPVLGTCVDGLVKDGMEPQQVLKYVGGIQFTIIAGILLASTFIPKGAVSLNPTLLFGEHLTGPVEGKKVAESFEMVDPEKPYQHGEYLEKEQQENNSSFGDREDVPIALAQAAHSQ